MRGFEDWRRHGVRGLTSLCLTSAGMGRRTESGHGFSPGILIPPGRDSSAPSPRCASVQLLTQPWEGGGRLGTISPRHKGLLHTLCRCANSGRRRCVPLQARPARLRPAGSDAGAQVARSVRLRAGRWRSFLKMHGVLMSFRCKMGWMGQGVGEGPGEGDSKGEWGEGSRMRGKRTGTWGVHGRMIRKEGAGRARG